MCAGSVSGRARRSATRRAPAPVTVRSTQCRSEPSRAPAWLRSISRLARVAGSISSVSPTPPRRGGCSAGSLPACVVSRCAARRPSADSSAGEKAPKPSSVATPYSRFSLASAAPGSARAAGMGWSGAPSALTASAIGPSANSRSGSRSSAGRSAARAGPTASRGQVATSTSPVESSTVATAACPARTASAASRLAPRASKQAVLGERAGRDHARHLAVHDRLRPPLLGRLWVFHLLADGDAEARADQLGEVGVGRVHRHAGHGDGLALVLAAVGQGDAQRLRRAHRVVEEQLVEVAHAEEDQRLGLGRLGREELRHHGRGALCLRQDLGLGRERVHAPGVAPGRGVGECGALAPASRASAQAAASRTTSASSCSSAATGAASAGVARVARRVQAVAQEPRAADSLDGALAEQGAEGGVVEPQELGEWRGAQFGAGVERRLRGAYRELVPGAGGQAVVAAVDAVAHGRPELLRPRPGVLDGEIGEAAARIDLERGGEGVGRAGAQARVAAAAPRPARPRRVGRQLQRGQDGAQEQPRAVGAADQVGVFALPTQARRLRQRLLQERRGVHEHLQLAAELGDHPPRQPLQPGLDHLVVVVAPGVDAERRAGAVCEDGAGILVRPVVHAQHHGRARLAPHGARMRPALGGGLQPVHGAVAAGLDKSGQAGGRGPGGEVVHAREAHRVEAAVSRGGADTRGERHVQHGREKGLRPAGVNVGGAVGDRSGLR